MCYVSCLILNQTKAAGETNKILIVSATGFVILNTLLSYPVAHRESHSPLSIRHSSLDANERITAFTGCMERHTRIS